MKFEVMRRTDRVYKSMPLCDFMKMCGFIFSHVGYHCVSLMQYANRRMNDEGLSDFEVKKWFLDCVKADVMDHELAMMVSIADCGDYFEVYLEWKTEVGEGANNAHLFH